MSIPLEDMTQAEWKSLQKTNKMLEEIQRLAALSEQITGNYEVSSFEDVIGKLIADYSSVVVTGGFFGDEGKGKLTDAIARHPSIGAIARVNGGSNAGHTIYHDGIKYVFHVLPSGMLIPGKINLIGPNVLVDPVQMFNTEINPLIQNGHYLNNLFIGNSRIATPAHRIMDRLINWPNGSTMEGISPGHAQIAYKSGLRMNDLDNAVLMGNPKLRDQAIRMLLKDMQFYYGLMHVKGVTEEGLLDDLRDHNYNVSREGGKPVPQHVLDFLDSTVSGTRPADKAEWLIFDLYANTVVNNPQFPRRVDTRQYALNIIRQGGKILLEGTQSFFLAPEEEAHWRKATSANTTARGVFTAASLPEGTTYVTFNVGKIPASRVGNGENPSGFREQDFFSRSGWSTLGHLRDRCTDFDPIQIALFNSVRENGTFDYSATYTDSTGTYTVLGAMAIAGARHHGECGATTQKPRVLSLYDCVHAAKVNEQQGPHFQISRFDGVNDYDKIGITIAYAFMNPDNLRVMDRGRTYQNGDVILAGDELPSEDVLKYCHAIVKVLEGGKNEPLSTEVLQPGATLPRWTQDLIANLEHYSSTPGRKARIAVIGNGPETENMVYLRRVENPHTTAVHSMVD